jgi:nucleotide-binding universal stress UspA family protein
MKRYKHILVPLDGSELAELALTDALSLAQLNQAEVVLLQVISPFEYIVGDSAPMTFVDELVKIHQDEALNYLEGITGREEGKNLKVHLAVEIGTPAETIIDYAHQEPIDLIVMATHGRSGLRRWVYGSVADKVLRGADVPILLVRAHPVQEKAPVVQTTTGASTPGE